MARPNRNTHRAQPLNLSFVGHCLSKATIGFARILFTGRLMVVRDEWIMHITVVGDVEQNRAVVGVNQKWDM